MISISAYCGYNAYIKVLNAGNKFAQRQYIQLYYHGNNVIQPHIQLINEENKPCKYKLMYCFSRKLLLLYDLMPHTF